MNIELLEPRIAPATITFNPALKTASWVDFDGDTVTLKYSIGDAPQFVTSDSGLGLIVNKILLAPAEHSSGIFSITVKKGTFGDGHAGIGRLDATDVPLKSWVSPLVDIAEIDAGNVTNAFGTLTVGSMGVKSYSEFQGSGGDGRSNISGACGAITIKGDVVGTALFIASGGGKVKSLTISGNLRGDMALGDFTGYVRVSGSGIGPVVVGGSLIGGSENADGQLNLATIATSVLVKGSVIGGTGDFGGYIDVSQCGAFTVMGSVVGSVGFGSGTVLCENSKTLTIGGSVVGGSEANSGMVIASSATTVLVKGSLIGGRSTTSTNGGSSGGVSVGIFAKSVTIMGDMIAGTYESGTKLSYNGSLFLGGAGVVTVKGSLLGNSDHDAMIVAHGETIANTATGNFNVIGKVIIGKDVSFGYIAAGHNYNSTFSERFQLAEQPDAGIGSVTVGGNWFHSSLSAGINDPGSNGIEIGDTRSPGDPAKQAIIGPVVIKGFIGDYPGLATVSGFAAEKIASITAGGQKLYKSGEVARSLDENHLIDIFEV